MDQATTSRGRRPGGHRKPRLLSSPLHGRSVLRIDYRFLTSEVVEQLSDRELRVWLRLLAYAAYWAR